MSARLWASENTHMIVNWVGVLYAFAAIAAGLLLALWAKRYLNVREAGWLVGAVLIPGTLSALFMGALAEFKIGPVEAKLRDYASSQVEPVVVRPTETNALEEFREKYAARANLGLPTPLVLVTLDGEKALLNGIELGGTPEEFWNMAASIQQSVYDDSFLAMVFVDQTGRVLAYFLKDTFSDLQKLTPFSTPVDDEDFQRRVKEPLDRFLRQNSELWLILQHPRARLKVAGRRLTIRKRATAAEAYSLMTTHRQDVVIVVDDLGNYATMAAS